MSYNDQYYEKDGADKQYSDESPEALVGLGLGWLLVESMGSNDSTQQNLPTCYRGNQRNEQEWQRYFVRLRSGRSSASCCCKRAR